MTSSREFLSRAAYDKHPSFFGKGDQPGKTIAGTIVEPPRVVTTEKLGQRGEFEDKLVIAIRNDADDQTYSVWAKGNMAAEIGKAVRAAGVTDLEEGGWLAVRYTGDGQPSQPGYNPPRLHEASYRPPARGVGLGALDQLAGAQAQPMPQPQAAPQQAAWPGQQQPTPAAQGWPQQPAQPAQAWPQQAQHPDLSGLA